MITAEKFNIYSMVTDRILAVLDKGVVPWRRPWVGNSLCVKRRTGEPYSFVNQLLLSPDFDGTLESLNSGEFATFKQIQAEGGKLRKGAKGLKVVFYKWYEVKDETSDDADAKKLVPILRYSTVFNIRDTDLEPKWTSKEFELNARPDAEAERMLTNYWQTEKIRVKRGGGATQAYYRPDTDAITLPSIDRFCDTAEYYSTAFHESVHSTGHESRLNRINKCASFGSEDYSKEELVAEIGASALVSMCGLETESSLQNNAAYIKGWRDAIAKDNKLIVSAAGKAEKAVSRILQPVAPAV